VKGGYPMSYYKKVLQPGETVKFVGGLHWMIYRVAILLVAIAIAVHVLFMFVAGSGRGVEYPIELLILLYALFSFLRSWFVRSTTEIVVTDRRIIHKVGWIGRRTQEMNISKVETVDVDQGIGGRILGFGAVLIRGVGGSWEPLHYVGSPLMLRGAILVG
jgi:uncharacterized membrane protein YdbT with pleckstrin-like domain